MTAKEIAIKTIQELPQVATWEDIRDRINFVIGIRKGLQELDKGMGISHERIKEEFQDCL